MSCLGHLIFIILHLAAIMFGVVGLLLTVPLHVLFTAATSSKSKR